MSSNILTGAGAGASGIPPEIKDKMNAEMAAKLAEEEAKDARRKSKRAAKQASPVPGESNVSISSSATLLDLPPTNDADGLPEQTVVPNEQVEFGTRQADASGLLTSMKQAREAPAQQAPVQPSASKSTAQVQQPPVQSTPPKSGGGLHIDPESREILRYISQDFVMLTANGDERAYHIASGDVFGKNGFIKYCSKHYGDLTITKADGSEERQPSGLIWWTWNDPLQRVARRIVMEPTSKLEHECNPEVFNLWYERKKDMCPPDMTATPESIKPLTDHLMYISDGDHVVVRYFMHWLAQLYQTPEIKIPSAFLFYSREQGVGKSTLYNLLSKVFGWSMVGNVSGRALTKGFDDAMEHKRLLVINEATRSDRADWYENFKNMISEGQTSFEGKGRPAKDIRNITHFVITTNHRDALPLAQGDRRIAVFQCEADRKPPEYYVKLLEWMDGPGPALVAGVLATWKFDADWNPYAPVPQTEAAKALQGISQGTLYVKLLEMREASVPPFNRGAVTADQIASLLLGERKHELWGCAVTYPAVGKALNKMGWKPWEGKVEYPGGKSGGARVSVYLTTPTDDWWRGMSPKDRGTFLKSDKCVFPVQDQPCEVANHE
ncbi:hypothetical protein PPTS312_28640 [Pseudomonas putida]|uniref:NrS-1 polymerase-like helicase domain-containing protein n=1 Tax=Pseudomonas putida TaxID=303 RepID=A0A7U6M3A7_PSEPU|nr:MULTISPECIES: primase-helicase family protein [Pseudomonas]MDD2124153.1 DUF5906 domain-containing protein [Pseudomonas monteilii]BBU44949.1 hypothetical protein PPTS312_28640 [Pseudomonas putida]